MEYTLATGTFLVIDTSSAAGGVSYDREYAAETAVAEGTEQVFRTTRKVDHAELVKLADQLVQQARYAIRKHAISTPLGWICDTDGLRQIIDEILVLEAKARGFNIKAMAEGCERRVRVGVVPVELHPHNVAAAREISRTVFNTLGELADMLADGTSYGSPKGVQRLETFVHVRCRNLDRLAVGNQRFSIQDALGVARDVIRAARGAVKAKSCPKADEFGAERLRICELAEEFLVVDEPGESADPVVELLDEDGESGESEGEAVA